MPSAIDLTGLKFGRLTGIARVDNIGRSTQWLWQCECGKQKAIAADKVKSGHTISCGCYFPEVCVKHGHTYVNGKQTRTYKAWANMKSRVQGKTERSRTSYLLKGITVCDRWKQFEGFLTDMGECPPGLTLDREDNNGNYEKDNCRWVPAAVQNRNKSDTVLVDYNGSQLPLKDACAVAGVLYDTALRRIRRGMTPELALRPQ